jgi:hypothetical protein
MISTWALSLITNTKHRAFSGTPTNPRCRLDTPSTKKDSCLLNPFPIDPHGNNNSSPESCFSLPSLLRFPRSFHRLRLAKDGEAWWLGWAAPPHVPISLHPWLPSYQCGAHSILLEETPTPLRSPPWLPSYRQRHFSIRWSARKKCRSPPLTILRPNPR